MDYTTRLAFFQISFVLFTVLVIIAISVIFWIKKSTKKNLEFREQQILLLQKEYPIGIKYIATKVIPLSAITIGKNSVGEVVEHSGLSVGLKFNISDSFSKTFFFEGETLKSCFQRKEDA